MSWLTGDWVHLGAVAGKAGLMYGTAFVALRLGERRTLAQWSLLDFVAAVATGAIVGRTAIASAQSFATGAVALVTLVALHRVASLLRFRPRLAVLMDHRVRILVVRGRVLADQLLICGMTDSDLMAQLRQRGVFELSSVRYVLYEAKGGLTVVPETGDAEVPGLLATGLAQAANRSDAVPENPPSR